MPRTVTWHRAEGGSFNASRQFVLDTALVLGPGVHIGRSRLTVHLSNNIGVNNAPAPTTGSMVMAGVRLGIDDVTPPGVDPRSGPNGVDWWQIEYVPPRILPRSTTNGWDLVQRTDGTREVDVGRITPGPANRVWLICSPVAVPGATAWVGTAYLEIQFWLP